MVELMFLHMYIIDYKHALSDYSLVGGQIPLPPRYAFGVFYSRYWAYNDIGEMVIPGFSDVQVYILKWLTTRKWCVNIKSTTSLWMFW